MNVGVLERDRQERSPILSISPEPHLRTAGPVFLIQTNLAVFHRHTHNNDAFPRVAASAAFLEAIA
jgi:hypothetical protein